MPDVLEKLSLREMDGTATLGELAAIDNINCLRDALYEALGALKAAASYWSDWHVPCVYEEFDNDCEVCPVISAVRCALSKVEGALEVEADGGR